MRIPKIALVCPSACVMGVTANCLTFGLMFYAKDHFMADTFMASLFYSFYSLAYLLVCMLGGKLLQRIHPLKSIFIGVIGLNLGVILLLLSPSLLLAYLCVAFCGGILAFYWPQLMGWLSVGLEGKAIARAASYFNLSWSTGSIAAPFLAGYLSDRNGIYPLYACMFLAFFNLLYVAVMSLGLEKDKSPQRQKDDNDAGAQIDRSPLIRFPSWIGLVGAWFVIGLICSAYPLMAEKSFGFSRQYIGNILLLRALFATVALLAMGFVTFWQFQYWQLFVGHLLLAICTLALGFVSNAFMTMFLMSLIGILCSHSYTNSMVHSIAGCPNRTFRMAIHETLLSIGNVLGGAICGWLYERTASIKICASTIAAVVLIAVFADIFYWLKYKKGKVAGKY